MALESPAKQISQGFEGAMAGLTLADVIQLKGLNRFSGCITVEYGEQTGQIFFRDGDIIHAEQDKESGDAAFFAIMRWPGGKFITRPTVTTTSHTIQDNWKFLLLEACRLMDESPAGTGAKSDVAVKSPPLTNDREHAMSRIADRLTNIPGVEYAVLHGNDGTPLDDESDKGQALAAQGFYLALIGKQLGESLGSGDIRSAAVQGKGHHLLLFESRQQYLSVAAKGDGSPAAIEAEIRKALAPQK